MKDLWPEVFYSHCEGYGRVVLPALLLCAKKLLCRAETSRARPNWVEALPCSWQVRDTHTAHCSECFFSLIAWILINPVVSTGSKFSEESIEASSSE